MAPILFLRSFGDFTIAISVLEHLPSEQRPACMASRHLEPLYRDLVAYRPSSALKISFVDIGISKKILGMFTNRHLLSLDSLKEVRELKRLLHSTEMHARPVFEQYRRLWLLRIWIGGGWEAVHGKGNVYDSYGERYGVKRNELAFDANRSNDFKRVLILPESRKKSKAFSFEFMSQLMHTLQSRGYQVITAFYASIPGDFKGVAKKHQAFMDLIRLMEEADVVVTADSLPAHLAQWMGKPHFVFYAGQPDPEWLTPFCRLHGSYDTMKNTGNLLDFIQTASSEHSSVTKQ